MSNFQDTENAKQFEVRKQSHLKLAIDPKNEAVGQTQFDKIELIHEALPELNFDDVEIHSEFSNKKLKTPFLISSMTAGHEEGRSLNLLFAKQASERGWIFAVGSQRRELSDPELATEWRSIRKEVPGFIALGNIGLSQLVQTPTEALLKLIEGLGASGLIIHLNALQEALQLEGTPYFKGGLKAIELLVKELNVPIIIKETGCGFSEATISRLNSIGLYALDVGGFGGTHWGRIEGARAEVETTVKAQLLSKASQTFSNWGISTLQSLLNGVDQKLNFELWASGGMRSGLDAAKALALGAKRVGFAKPILQAALEGEDALSIEMQRLELELRIAMFCTGKKSLSELKDSRVWKWKSV